VPAPAVFWPTRLGVAFLALGLITSWRDVHAARSRHTSVFLALGPAFIAASLAAFAGEHFTAAQTLAKLVPGWLPWRLFIAYFVGVAHLAAALSIVTRRYRRWSALGLIVMFGLFVLLMDLPGAVAHPAVRLSWILVVRETTFAMAGVALFASVTRAQHPRRSEQLAIVASLWIACVLIYYGIIHIRYPKFSPGVPDSMLTAAWVPAPLILAYATGILLIVIGLAIFAEKYTSVAAAYGGFLFLVLTLGLYVPQYVLAGTVSDQVNAINFVFDTLLFAGTVLVIGKAIADTESPVIAVHGELDRDLVS
jgi:uncharacterized membrane protein